MFLHFWLCAVFCHRISNLCFSGAKFKHSGILDLQLVVMALVLVVLILTEFVAK